MTRCPEHCCNSFSYSNCLHHTDIYYEWDGWSDPENILTQRWGSTVDAHVGTKWIWLNRGHASLDMQTIVEPKFGDEKFAEQYR